MNSHEANTRSLLRSLTTSAANVVSNWERGDLASAVNDLQQNADKARKFLETPPPAEPYETRLDDCAGRLVANDIRLCVSSLVSDVLQGAFQEGTLIDEDEAVSLGRMEPDADDYSEASDYADDGFAITVQADDDGGFCWTVTDADGDELNDGCADTEAEAWREAFDEAGRDQPEGREVFEHWAVSSYMAEKLRERGHSVTDALGLTIWGRPTTGQMIRMDSVIRDIAREIVGPEDAETK